MNRKWLRLWRICVVLLLLLVAVGYQKNAVFAEGEEVAIEMTVSPAFDGVFKFGSWLPIWVEVSNSGPSLDAEIRVQVINSAYVVPVSLPSGAEKRLPVYIIPNNYSKTLKVELVDENGKTLLGEKVSVSPQLNANYLIGVVTEERGALSLIQGIELSDRPGAIEIVDVNLADLPGVMQGLETFDVLIFEDVDTSILAPEQVMAMEAWVARGGRLVIGGGQGWRQTYAAFENWLDELNVSEGQEVEGEALSGLADFVGAESLPFSGSYYVTKIEAPQKRVLIGDEASQALVYEQAVGQGYIDFSALSLCGEPFDGWSGTRLFWENLLLPGSTYPNDMPVDMNERQMRAGSMQYALTNMPALDLPSIKMLSILLGVYILLVGPANYFLLKKKGKLHWAWISIPALTILFSAVTFGLGYFLRGNEIVLNTISVVMAEGDGNAWVTNYVGLFSPKDYAYEVEIDNSSLISSLNDNSVYFGGGGGGVWQDEEFVDYDISVSFLQGETSGVRGLSVDQWSMQSFMYEEFWSDFNGFGSDLRLDGDKVVGTIENLSPNKIGDVVVLLNGNFERIGDLEPGEIADVSLAMSSTFAKTSGLPLSYALYEEDLSQGGVTSRDVQFKRTVLDSLSGYDQFSVFSSFSNVSLSEMKGQGVVIFGWMDTSRQDVRVKDQDIMEQETSLVISAADYELELEDRLELPPGLLTGEMVQTPQDGGRCGANNSASVMLFSGEAIFEFVTPFEGYEVEQLKLSMNSDMGGMWMAPETALYYWQEERWVTLKEPVQGVNLIENGSRFVNADGVVQIRLSNQLAGRSQCIFLGLGLEAVQQESGGLEGGQQ